MGTVFRRRPDEEHPEGEEGEERGENDQEGEGGEGREEVSKIVIDVHCPTNR